MQNDKTYSNAFLSLVKTREEANLLYSEVSELEKTIFKTDENAYAEALNSKVRAISANYINSMIAGRDKSDFFKAVKDAVTTLKYLELTISFEPTTETLFKISDWARKNINPSICLDIKIDKKIIGGAVVTYNGRIKDYSLVGQVDSYFNSIKNI